MENILVPTDFSLASRNAAEYAVFLAQSFDATLHLVNVVPPQVITDDYILAPVMTTQAELVTKHTELMKHEIKTLSKIHPVRISAHSRTGYASEIIPEIAKETDSALIVMGMKGEGRSNSLFGSTTTAVIRKSSYPVFVIPEEANFEPVNEITLASDFDSKIEMDNYTVLIELADKFNSHIKILHVENKDSVMNREEAIGMIKTSKVFSRHECQFHSIREENVETGISNFLKKNHSDILAMVARRHSLFNRLFGKMHTKAMAYQTRIPLLVLQNK